MIAATTAVRDVETFAPFERVEFPNGSEVFYRESDHRYYGEVNYKGGKWTGVAATQRTGVSTLCSPYDYESDGLCHWSTREEREAMVRLFGGRTFPEDPGAVYGMLKANDLTWWALRNKAGERGKRVHKAIAHALATSTDDGPDIGVLPEEDRGYGQALMRWWLKRDPQVSHAEQIVGSVEHRFAGTLDLRAKIKDPLRPGFGIVDYKCGNNVWPKDCAQPAGYDIGGLHSGLWDEPAEWLLIVHLKPNGDYDEVWSPATHEHFLNALAVYRDSQAFGKVVRAAS